VLFAQTQWPPIHSLVLVLHVQATGLHKAGQVGGAPHPVFALLRPEDVAGLGPLDPLPMGGLVAPAVALVGTTGPALATHLAPGGKNHPARGRQDPLQPGTVGVGTMVALFPYG
jgi:hypothetical protein